MLQASAKMSDSRSENDNINVLVVEDEDLIRDMLVETLADIGFEVHQAAHSAEAIELLEQRWEAIHVLFTDINMPGVMDGVALAHHADKHWPRIALLVTSALPLKDRELPPRARFVGKPYRTGHIVTHIRELTRAADAR